MKEPDLDDLLTSIAGAAGLPTERQLENLPEVDPADFSRFVLLASEPLSAMQPKPSGVRVGRLVLRPK